jgi:hypothetical protein
MLGVVHKMTFPLHSEKHEWIDETHEWRLPYWDWGLFERYSIPAIFTTLTIKLLQPKNADGSNAPPVEHINPLRRYQMTEKTGALLPMGNLSKPYTVSDDPFLVLPVRKFHTVSGT